jgi:hypothetical protein
MARDPFRPVVPETDPPRPVHDVNSHWQVFSQMSEQLWVLKQTRKHGKSAAFQLHGQHKERTSGLEVLVRLG